MRYGIAFVTHFCNFTLMAQNSIISITMVAMVNNTDHPPHLNSSTEQLPAGLSGDQHEASKHLPIKVDKAKFKLVFPVACVRVRVHVGPEV